VRPQGFPKDARLLRRLDFSRVRHGRRIQGRHFVAFVAPRAEVGARLGLAVSARIGHAVSRNRVRRLAREAFRRHRAQLGALDVLLVARPSARGASYEEVERDLLRACQR
jgi:ribonuclease P protein component